MLPRPDFLTKEVRRLLREGIGMACRAEARKPRDKNARLRTACFSAAAFARELGADEGWSQSPVLPWTQRAYETCLSAGSTAFELSKWSPHPELHQAGLLTEQIHR